MVVDAALDELLEREQALAAIATLVRQVRTGACAVLVFEAPAGLGKTTLLGARRGVLPGLLVVQARGRELERAFAWCGAFAV